MPPTIGLNRENVILDNNLEVSQMFFFLKKEDISTAKYQNIVFNILCALLRFIIHLNVFLVFAMPIIPLKFCLKMTFYLYFSIVQRQFSVIIASV